MINFYFSQLQMYSDGSSTAIDCENSYMPSMPGQLYPLPNKYTFMDGKPPVNDKLGKYRNNHFYKIFLGFQRHDQFQKSTH